MKTAAEIKKEVLEAASGDIKAAIAALEDGKYLADAGYTDEDQEAIEAAHAELKRENMVNLSREVFYHYFCDESGQQYSGHPDELCVSRETVVEQFPQTAEWPVLGEHGDRFGYVLGNGVYLFPDFDFENPAFAVI